MASESLLHPLLLQPHDSAVLEDLERQQRDGMVAAIARRISDNAVLPIERRCVKQTIRPLAFPVFVGQVRAVCVVTVYYVGRHPRRHEQERFWYESLVDAKTAHPKAQLLDDPQCVAPRLRSASA